MLLPTSCSYGTMSVDSKVIERAQAGDKEAFGVIFAETQEELARFIRGKISDHYQSEEILAETYKRAMVAISQTKPDLKLMAWLKTIAHHLVIDFLRVKTRPYSLEERNELHQEELVAEIEEDHRDLSGVVKKMMRRLPPDQALALRLQSKGLSYVEIASKMGKEPAQVKGILERGRKSAKSIFRDLTGVDVPAML